VGGYFLNNYPELKFKYIRKISRRKNNVGCMVRLVTGYSFTKVYLYKMGLADTTKCSCNFEYQDINHIFWACPLLKEDRKVMLDVLRALKLQDPFSVEYLLGSLNKKIAAICQFMDNVSIKLKLTL